MSTSRILKGLVKMLEKLISHPSYVAIDEEVKEIGMAPTTWDGIYDAENLPLLQGEKSEGMSRKL